jgi:hypothetical protein
MSDAAGDIFRSLVAERGGAGQFDETQKIVALKLAEMLASDAAVSAPAIVALIGLLPPKASDTEAPYDLSKLSDKEFAELDRLTAIAAGLKPSKPDKPRRHPLRSYRETWAAIFAHDVDAIAGEIENARRRGRVHVLDDFERATLHNACRLWLSLIIEPAQLWPEIAESARCEERKKSVAVPAVAVLDAPAAPAAGAPAATAVAPGAVVPLFGAFIGKRHIPGESSRSEARTDDLPRGRW